MTTCRAIRGEVVRSQQTRSELLAARATYQAQTVLLRPACFRPHRGLIFLSWLSPAGAGAEFPGNHESGQPGLFWPESLPDSGELQYRDRGGRELEPNPLKRTRIASPGAGERQGRSCMAGACPTISRVRALGAVSRARSGSSQAAAPYTRWSKRTLGEAPNGGLLTLEWVGGMPGSSGVRCPGGA